MRKRAVGFLTEGTEVHGENEEGFTISPRTSVGSVRGNLKSGSEHGRREEIVGFGVGLGAGDLGESKEDKGREEIGEGEMDGELEGHSGQMPRQEHVDVGEGGVDDAEEAEEGACQQVEGGVREAAVDHFGQEAAPEHAGQDEPVAEDEEDENRRETAGWGGVHEAG